MEGAAAEPVLAAALELDATGLDQALHADLVRRAAFDRLLAIAPALEAAGVEPMSEDEIAVEVRAARAERRARQQISLQAGNQQPGNGAA